MAMSIPKEVLFAAYGLVLLAWTWKAGFSSLFAVVFLGAIPSVLAIMWYSEAFAPFTGLIDTKISQDQISKARHEAKENFRQLMERNGGESVEWLNFLIEQMWPYIAEYAEKIIWGMEETIQKSVPVGIHFKTVSLGKEPIRFGPINPRITSCYYNNEYIEEGGVELKIGVDYSSDCEIILQSGFATVGATSLTIQGTMSVHFRPLHNESPFFGGIEILFTNPPRVDLDFKGIGNLADMPGIYGTVRRIIDDAIAGVMVTPNRIASSMTESDKVDLARLRNPPPEGVLRIKVLKASNLSGKDWRLIGANTSDPYTQIKVGCESFRTPTISKTCNPVWTKENVKDFVVYSLEQYVFIDLYDYDMGSADDALGSVMLQDGSSKSLKRISVSQLLDLAKGGTTSFRLYAASERDDDPSPDASVELQVTWLWLTDPTLNEPLQAWLSAPTPAVPSQEPPANKFVITMKIDECKHMPGSLNAPFTIRLSVKDTTLKQESNPGWSKWSTTMSLKTLDTIRKLKASLCTEELIAEIADVHVDLLKEFLEYDKSSYRRKEAKDQQIKDDEAWLEKLSQSRTMREQTLNPQFEQVLLLLSPKKDLDVLVEVLDNPAKRTKNKKEAHPGVIAKFETQLGSAKVFEPTGGFKLLDPKTGAPLKDENGKEAVMLATFTLWALEKASKNTKWRAIGHVVGAINAARKRRGAEDSSPVEGPSPTDQESSDQLAETHSIMSSISTMTGGRVRKRDKLRSMVNSVFHRNHADSPTRASILQAGQAAATALSPNRRSSVGIPRKEKTTAELAADAIEGYFAKDVLFGLGMLRNLKDWDQARDHYRRKYSGGKGNGDLITALELELHSNEDRNKAAAMLQAHGIGTGTWPPPGRLAGESGLAGLGAACVGPRRSCQ
mmetsp:Transcript_28583/g.62172  ORF Transcript_28583/g.62172 Transcript_28583/m.62172 type:complete len:898 (+) Transcript_28583:892-3585(+)|eukprot:CAMPEP_0206456336 /NCGR_PEP_ID=MMETSP0324_2-20121206/22304_1 /ASSEMBLY_ACC=CAM_ASM_000836 /TAXON_ID=2866 /ORGANISM="Crypthecodinium cohnii, Strain Seligo" /LENGTH=897 /DNA_ID=CAMNT_0053927245 /DNA_START=788 /DNA_END=3481 /DNA_ORIENTATION=-